MNAYQIFRFVKSIDEMHTPGTVIFDKNEILFWIKRFAWVEVETKMDPKTFELCLIGRRSIDRPFIGDHSEAYLRGIQDLMARLVRNNGPTEERTILVEEIYDSFEDAQRAGVT